MAVQTAWKYLEHRPKKQTQQLCIQGRNMTVWHLVQPIIVRGETPEQVADGYRLPVEAVHEALEYYAANEGMIQREVAEERRLLQEAGLLAE
jgi:uncharacterized protein (DUF433 family)